MLFQVFGGRGFGFFQRLENLGVFDGLFPFILVYAVVFGILQKIKLFGTEKPDQSRKLNVVIALVTAAAFVYPHYSGRYVTWGMPDPVVIINNAIPQVGIALIAILMFMIMVGLLGFKKVSLIQNIAVIGSVFFVLYVFLSAANVFNLPFFAFLNDPDLQFFIVFILGLGLLINFLSSEKKSDEGPSAADRLAKFLGAAGFDDSGKKKEGE